MHDIPTLVQKIATLSAPDVLGRFFPIYFVPEVCGESSHLFFQPRELTYALAFSTSIAIELKLATAEQLAGKKCAYINGVPQSLLPISSENARGYNKDWVKIVLSNSKPAAEVALDAAGPSTSAAPKSA